MHTTSVCYLNTLACVNSTKDTIKALLFSENNFWVQKEISKFESRNAGNRPRYDESPRLYPSQTLCLSTGSEWICSASLRSREFKAGTTATLLLYLFPFLPKRRRSPVLRLQLWDFLRASEFVSEKMLRKCEKRCVSRKIYHEDTFGMQDFKLLPK